MLRSRPSCAGLLVGERAAEAALILLDRSIVGDAVFLGGIFSPPTEATVEVVNPRSMSPTPQMTKLTMMSPMTTVMTALPTTP